MIYNSYFVILDPCGGSCAITEKCTIEADSGISTCNCAPGKARDTDTNQCLGRYDILKNDGGGGRQVAVRLRLENINIELQTIRKLLY